MAGNLYTRCPHCRSELSFPRPDNMEQLPDDYRLTINCPNCGTSIAVKLNKVDRSQDAQYPQEGPVNFIPTLSAENEISNDFVAPAAAEKAKPRNPIGRNLFMLITSLVFIVLHVLGAFYPVLGSNFYMGISSILLLIESGVADLEIIALIMDIVYIVMFAIPCLCFIVSLIGLICKKYGAAFHLIMTILELLITIGILVLYFMTLGASGLLSILLSLFMIQPVLTLIQFIVTIVFCARRAPKARRK